MQSSQHTELPEKIRKTRRNKKGRACPDKRRAGGCGICGSENIAFQGVTYCTVCGIERIIFEIEEPWWIWNRSHDPLPCNCTVERKIGNKIHRFRDYGRIHVAKCIDCGAVRSSFCPNGKEHKCWKKDQQYFCTFCGYRKEK